MDVFYSWSDPARHLDTIDSAYTLLDCLKLGTGEYVSFFSSLGLLPLDIFEFRALSGHGGLVMGFDLEREGGDVRGISSHEIVQEREGSATLYSLHNMRIKKVRKEDADQYPHLLTHWTGQPIKFLGPDT